LGEEKVAEAKTHELHMCLPQWGRARTRAKEDILTTHTTQDDEKSILLLVTNTKGGTLQEVVSELRVLGRFPRRPGLLN
jgi:hypothetical protein